jgi:hypothetical protein
MHYKFDNRHTSTVAYPPQFALASLSIQDYDATYIQDGEKISGPSGPWPSRFGSISEFYDLQNCLHYSPRISLCLVPCTQLSPWFRHFSLLTDAMYYCSLYAELLRTADDK